MEDTEIGRGDKRSVVQSKSEIKEKEMLDTGDINEEKIKVDKDTHDELINRDAASCSSSSSASSFPNGYEMEFIPGQNDVRYRCFYCGAIFQFSKGLYYHRCGAKDRNGFLCYICLQYIQSFRARNEHISECSARNMSDIEKQLAEGISSKRSDTPETEDSQEEVSPVISPEIPPLKGISLRRQDTSDKIHPSQEILGSDKTPSKKKRHITDYSLESSLDVLSKSVPLSCAEAQKSRKKKTMETILVSNDKFLTHYFYNPQLKDESSEKNSSSMEKEHTSDEESSTAK